MDNVGFEQGTPNGFKEHMGTGQQEPSRDFGSASRPSSFGEQWSNKREAAGSTTDGTSFDSLFQFARELQSKIKDVPYAVPVAAAGAGFVLGVFASSRILRQLAMIAGARALHFALQQAPTDELLAMAKKAIVDSFRPSGVA